MHVIISTKSLVFIFVYDLNARDIKSNSQITNTMTVKSKNKKRVSLLFNYHSLSIDMEGVNNEIGYIMPTKINHKVMPPHAHNRLT